MARSRGRAPERCRRRQREPVRRCLAGAVMLLLLKLVAAPLVIGLASIGAQRSGPAIGGWLASLPITSGLVALFLALEYGPAFGAAAAAASLAGTIAIVCFCVAYGLVAGRRGWRLALTGAGVGWIVGALIAERGLSLPLVWLVALVGVSWVLGFRLMPALGRVPPAVVLPRWDVPLRMGSGTLVVVLITAAASILGPGISGLLATIPVIGAVIALFAHIRQGPLGAIGVLRGILVGLVGTTAFLGVVSATLVPLGVATSFLAASLTIAVVGSITVQMVRLTAPRAGA